MSHFRRGVIVTLVTAFTLLAAACGGSEAPTAASGDAEQQARPSDDAGGDDAAHGGDHAASERAAAPVDGAEEVVLTAVDIDFEPAQLELKAGEPVNVTIVNEGEALHDFTLEAADVHINVEPGQSKTAAVTVDEPGRYEAKCTVAGHAEAGMTIDVVVV